MTGKMLHIRTLKALLLTLMLCMAGCGTALAQQFSVTKFRVLPNDVSAFITPVRDLNDEACALLKVTATPEYAFSSPLGIVMRKDNVGEIWLYLPKGTKKITIKHPEWGVMRDYKFEKPLESHMTYEMVINSPKPDIALKHDTIVLTKTIVDTIAVKKRRAAAQDSCPVYSFDARKRTFVGCHGGINAPPWLLRSCKCRPAQHRQDRNHLRQGRIYRRKQHKTILHRTDTPLDIHRDGRSDTPPRAHGQPV